ncbi:diacylglycerol kinase family protein [Ilumatobacter coccineus]|uniref:Uncharacterized protein n=1 Tax=Ilumatobacter coccineus (strain NBRC 103263 / KCTC 29153 / YM16-304) TaxID=1313172 RepID=A0A6C7E928_ILUCY|nr:hypothetical protein [Ilumatobacter coccineus]BAN02910.1 hypothetical protein YM304_25960 [Ilumatobacter coccineus YM16-304]
MTIEKGADWGSEVERPADLVIAQNDAELASMLARDDTRERPVTDVAVAVANGDVFTTVGARPIGDRRRLRRVPIDLVHVRLDGRASRPVVAHVLARLPWSRGGWWRGPVLAVMNAEFVGPYDVAPRGHPNDGRAETFALATDTSLRQRLAIRSRMRAGTHLPHPAIASRPVRQGSWTFETPLVVIADGVTLGRASTIEIEVEPDAGWIHT